MPSRLSPAARWLLRGLVLLLVPVVFIAMPQVANAATTEYGVWDTAKPSHDNPGPIPGSVGCNINVRWQVPTGPGPGQLTYVQVGDSSACMSPMEGATGFNVGDAYTITLLGPGCDAGPLWLGGTFAHHPDDSWSNELVDVEGGLINVPAGCQPTTLCLSGGYAWDDDFCDSITLGVPPVPVSGSCGVSNLVAIQEQQYVHTNGTMRRRINFRWDTSVTASQWFTTLSFSNGTNTSALMGEGNSGTGTDLTMVNVNAGWAQLGLNPPSGVTLLGVTIWHSTTPSTVGTNTAIGPTGRLGKHDPTRCLFYVGAKLYDEAGNDFDTPGGALDGTTPPTGAGDLPEPVGDAPPGGSACSFDVMDPSTWLEGGMCAVVGLLRGIWDTLKNLAGAIFGPIVDAIEAIWDGFVSLFIPADGFLDAKTNDLADAWDASAPGSYASAFTDQSFNLPGSSCSGIPVHFDIGVAVDFNLGNSCSGVMSNVANIIKLVMSAVLVIFGGLACVRGIGAGFGWSPSLSRGAEV